MSDASPKTLLVTGATDGIGRQTALELAQRGHQVILHGRNADKVAATREALNALVPAARLDGVAFDLASLDQVRQGAAELRARFTRLDVLINNAGVYVNDYRRSADGFELSFAVNHLAPFLLTHELLPLLRSSAPARIVNVSSVAHHRGRIDLAQVAVGKPDAHEGYAAYAASKLANVLFTRELASQLAGSGVSVFALHPGVINTKMLRDGFGMPNGAPVASGTATSLHCALAPGLEALSGAYFDAAAEARVGRAATDPELQRGLWALSERLCGIAEAVPG